MADTPEGVKKDIKEFQDLKTERATFDNNWLEVEELVVPQRGTVVGGRRRSTPGDERREDIFDSTAVFANEQFAALLASQLINPALKWLAFRITGEIGQRKEIADWLANARDAMLEEAFMSNSANFHPSAHEFLLDLGGFGTGAHFIEEALELPAGMHFSARPIQQIYAKENHRGFVDTVFIEMILTTRQAAQKYGFENLPQKLRERMDKEPNKQTTFVQIIRPRERFDRRRKAAVNKPIESTHIWLESKNKGEVVLESGFDEMPIIVARPTKLSGEVYGRGPGMQMLPDIRMLQRMAEINLTGAQLAMRPPLQAPDDGVIGPVRFTPLGVNFIRAGSQGEIKPINHAAQPLLGEALMDRVRSAILRGFFLNPADLNPPEPRVTATAIIDRRDERFRRMTPMLTRLQVEWLVPLVDRVFAIMQRQRKMPTPPQILMDRAGENFEVMFTSPAAQAQLLTEADNLTRFVSRVLPAFELDPDSRANVDWDNYVQTMGRDLSIPPEILRDPRRVQEFRRSQEEQDAQREALAQAGQAGEAAKDLADAVRNANES